MKERGQALLLLLTLLIFVGASSFFTFLSPSSGRLKEEEQTRKIMREARDALIGYAAASSVRPGQLPCPDTNNDGLAESSDGSGCPSGNIGRLPWTTLGLDDVRDSAGERLWYAVSTNFTRDPALCGSCPLNSDTKGTLTVYQDSTATVITSQAVAVIFAPGPAFGGQVRDAANVNNPANYLDTTGGVSNGTPPLFVKAQLGDTFNDRLTVIDTTHLIPVVEQRVAREVIALLEKYKTQIGAYPWADCSDGSSDLPPDYRNRGRIPYISTLPTNWGSGGAPSLPTWFSTNKWAWVIYYSAGKIYLQGGGTNCTTCVSSELTVTGVGTKRVVIIMTGPAGASRPVGTPGVCNPSDWAAYLEDLENSDHNDDTFTLPASTAYARDRLYACPGIPDICP